MSEWKSKRFWTSVNVGQTEGGWQVELDGRPVRTPSKNILTVPTAELASLIAVEWDAQQDVIRPDVMPATRMANSAIEKVTPQKQAVAEALLAFGETDLLCYRADGPEGLIELQSARWDPMLDWAADALGARLQTSTGVLPVAQPPEALESLAGAVGREDAFGLAALHDLVHLSGSLVLGLAVCHEAIDAGEAWALSRIDEEWQISMWGRDDESYDVASRKRAAILEAETFYRAIGGKPS